METLIFGLTVTGIGVAIVFAGLIVLIGLIKLVNIFTGGSGKPKKEKKAKASREERGYTAARGPKKKDDWKQFFAPENSKWLKGEKPDFEEEGWARRKPKKK